MQKLKTLAVIPARSGSKGVPNKNIRLLGKKPLLAYTVEQALQSKYIDDVAVSTDSVEIAEVAEKYGLEVHFMRPKELASDKALTAPVVAHAKEEMERISNKKYDIIILLQPTCPFRTHKEIDDAILALNDTKFTSVTSVKSVDGNHPFRMKRIIDENLVNFIDQGFEDMRPRQDLPPVYIRDGSIYAVRSSAFDKDHELVTESCKALINERSNNINIDTMHDFRLAELILNDLKS